MQEIAEACKMSKGSLYLHFKSKEELQLNIFYYFSQMLGDNIVKISQESELSVREQFGKQLHAILKLIIEYREYLLLQIREFAQKSNEEFHTFLQEKTNQLLEWMAQRIIDLYGQRIAPHAIDMALLLNGMLHSYMRFFVIKQLPFTPERFIQFILTKLDHLANGIDLDSEEPLISIEMWASFSNQNWFTGEEPVHPLMLLKEIRELLERAQLDSEHAEEMLQSLQILEVELMELTPRRAIIKGMLHNLNQITEVRPLLEKLAALL